MQDSALDLANPNLAMLATLEKRSTRFLPLAWLLVLSALVGLPAAAADAQDAPAESSPGIAQQSTPQDDGRIADRLRGIFAEIDSLHGAVVSVSAGVVELGGEVDSLASAARAARLAGQVAGVVDVQNELTIDRNLDNRIESTRQTLASVAQDIAAGLPLFLVALGVFLAFWLLGAWLGRRQRLFRRISPNVFIASLLGQIAHLLFIVLGLVLALVLLDATALLGTILGAAGILGLAVGFAVRDTVENYIASILLSLRNPFDVNYFVDVAGQQGNVVKLTSRATILLSPEGNHVRIPNATVFKAVIVNYTRMPERRFEFDVGVDTDHDLVAAQKVALDSLRSVPGVLADPAAMTIIHALGDSSVVLRCYGWVNQRQNSFVKVRSEAIRRVKEAFDQAGIVMPEPVYRLRITDRVEAGGERASSAPVRSGSPGGDSSSTAGRTGEVTDVGVDRAIEERVIADARSGEGENLLSQAAEKEI